MCLKTDDGKHTLLYDNDCIFLRRTKWYCRDPRLLREFPLWRSEYLNNFWNFKRELAALDFRDAFRRVVNIYEIANQRRRDGAVSAQTNKNLKIIFY